MGSSHSRDHTCISSTGKRILYHRAHREALRHIFDSSFPHMCLMREAGIKRPGHWESSATVLAVSSKALGPLASTSASLGLFPPLRNALLWTVAHQAPLSLGFLRPEYWRGCHCLLYKVAFGRYCILDGGFDEGRGIPSRALEWILV